MSSSTEDPGRSYPAQREAQAGRPGLTAEPVDGALRKVFLIRHADASEGPKDGEGGRHLTSLGVRQATALARRIARWRVDEIVCSDKHRSYETALAVKRHHPEVPLSVDPMFREASRKIVDGFERGDPEHEGLLARLEGAWDRISNPSRETTVFIVHTGLIKYFLGRAMRLEGVLKPRFHCTETGITLLQIAPTGPFVDFFNDTRHLTPDIVTPGQKVPWFEDQLAAGF